MALTGGTYTGSATTKANANVFIPELWSDEVKRQRDTKFVVANTVKRFNFIGKKGDVLHVPNISRLSVYDKLPETPVTLQARTESEYSILIDKYKESSFMVEDIVHIQSAYDLMKPYTEEAGYALARDIDNYLLGLRAAVYHNASQRIDLATAIDKAAILAAKSILDNADVPQEGRKLIVSPDQYNDLLTITEFISKDFQAAMPVASGVVGSIYGVEVWMTTQLGLNSATGYKNGDGAAAQPTPGYTGSPYLPTQDAFTSLPLARYSAMMVHADWAGLAVQLNPKMESERAVTYQADVIVQTQLYGGKLYRPDHAVVISTTA
jgi:N4-gp56 family major capsid protein